LLTDSRTGARGALLRGDGSDPLLIEVNTSTEYWQKGASLLHTDPLGKGDVFLPTSVRTYMVAGTQHGGRAASTTDPGNCRWARNPHSAAPVLRALRVALDDWADRGIAPPKSNYPTLADQTLVTIAEAKAAFPAIPGVNFPTVINGLALPQFGPGFKTTGGKLTQLPPGFGGTYQLYVPKPDKDGLDIAGIRPVEVAAPTATITGWNVRAMNRRGPELCALSGSYLPFAKTRAERQASGDPRPSLEERYVDQAGFVKAVEQATSRLMRERFLLKEDADRYIKAARDTDLMKNVGGSGL